MIYRVISLWLGYTCSVVFRQQVRRKRAKVQQEAGRSVQTGQIIYWTY